MDSVFRVKFVTFLVLLSAGSSIAVLVVKPGRCPNINGQTKFDKSRYVGMWYEYKRFPDIAEGGLECTNYAFRDALNSMVVTKRGIMKADLFGKTFVRRNYTDVGVATMPDTDKPAEFNLVFGERALRVLTDAPGQKANFIIHDTDYKNYSVVFSCTQVDSLNIQNAYILTRVRGVAPPNLAQLENKLTEAGVDVSAFFVVNQKGCPDKIYVKKFPKGY